MKFTIPLIVCISFGTLSIKAQDEHHTMPTSPKKTIAAEKINDNISNKKENHLSKTVIYDLYVRDTTVILGKNLNEPLL
ncbi:pullulanase/glycogen debranching enzyme [Arcicella sp. BE140]|uniref:hypothetical protein n=1 Tax=Arcicella sp. BE140 TaxID=2817847 RepID=UPI00286233D7|nr:hypothetical protein [Arcicella sp. BE140]MDR6563846.1 pullulanase/glycogen debranching enzyme [Arcicella sp. BE51]MDR6813470.1 pullulanase/glycogen debranching enzyme [Arcicella sp. BE140]MDR6824783.1 pullulanase/glycogen debranching enzyme [Arcicella sp. BE139]